MKKVLLVDDDEIFLEFMERFVLKGVECFTAKTFKGFTKSFSERKYDLIITDFNLSISKTAEDVLMYIGSDSLVIVMTGEMPSKEQQKVLMDLGCKEIITKPMSREEALESLSEFLPKKSDSN